VVKDAAILIGGAVSKAPSSIEVARRINNAANEIVDDVKDAGEKE
jgi:hypothetical protein